MKNLYFDSSALLKRYLEEKGSQRAESLFIESEIIISSEILWNESLSCFSRLLHDKAISEAKFNELKLLLQKDLNSINLIPVDSQILELSRGVIEKHNLRTLDSIHYASLLSSLSEIDAMVTADEKLSFSAKKDGIAVINPEHA